ncbi:nuclear transport factor 2 family protein [Mycobacterium sp. pW049]|uniref:nuclear transport factor 2 family protein n=1 Tax=[Mycobacterium] bulgaricum TaxID=3238985 RepID=UPI00351AFE30
MTADDALQEMLDEHQLRKLVHRYCRAVDRGDVDELRSLYHHDASDSHGSFSSGSATDFIDQIAAARPYLRSMQHHVTTADFAIDGDAAEGEIYTIATHTFVADGRDVDVIVGGRYLDRYAKRDGTWRIVERAIVTDTAHVNDPSTRDLTHPITRNTPIGSPGDDDPSHGFFTLLRSAPPR